MVSIKEMHSFIPDMLFLTMASSSFLVLCLAAAVGSASEVDRIVGGEPTTIEKYPVIVQVDFFLETNIWAQMCGGSVLTTRYILSAAHCFMDPIYYVTKRRVRAGSSYRNTGGTISYLSHIINHPTFGHNDYDGDIALLILQTPLVYSNVIAQAAIVGHGFEVPDNLQVLHIGWGMVVLGGDRSEVLREVEVLTINNDLCRERYEANLPPRVVTTNMICAGLIDVGGKGPCYGDSGSPMFYDNIVIGVVAWGVGCANATTPGVNTAVSPYTRWILENVN